MILQIYTRSCLFPPEGEQNRRREVGIEILQELTAQMILHLNQKYGVSRDALDPGARKLSDSWEQRSLDPRQQIRAAFIEMRVEARCATIGCTESLQTSSTLKCSGCQFLCWCSKEHQKRTWTDSRCTHRDVCRTMGQLFKATGENLDDAAAFGRSVAKMPAADVIGLAGWLDRFRALRGHIAYDPSCVFLILGSHLQCTVCSAIDCPSVGSTRRNEVQQVQWVWGIPILRC
ncbi:hypothetical protein C8R44DRAFT_773994 [Mycena epipterygia]|nr:hypothetical protein C8R44DRAFT_773994 [Mycena epipterygia]